jgi:hypothetical protein
MPPASGAGAELFHRIAEADSAAARRRVGQLGLAGVAFRNVDFPSHDAALAARGGSGATPALWDGERLHEGLAAVEAALARLDAAP